MDERRRAAQEVVRKEFRDHYDLDGDFLEARQVWGEAMGRQLRLTTIDQVRRILDIRNAIQSTGDMNAIEIVKQAISFRPLDAEDLRVQRVFARILSAIEIGLEELRPFEISRTEPSPDAALMIARSVLLRVPLAEAKPKTQKNPPKKLKNKIVESLAVHRVVPARISQFLIDVGYTESEANIDNVNTTVSKLRAKSIKIPQSPTKKISKSYKPIVHCKR